MSDLFWKRLSAIFGIMAFGVLFGLLVFSANVEIKDLDLWLHIGTGRFIVEHGFVPDRDVLSATMQGQPWINHEWLFQVVVYEIYKLWGAEGLVTMQVSLVVLTMFLLLLLGYSRDRQIGTLMMLLLIFLIYQTRLTHRPDLFSLLFFVLFIYILALHIDKRWSVYALVVIQVLWTNFHGFFFFGPLIVLIGTLAEWVKRHVPLPYEWNKIGRLTDAEYRRLKIILAVVILACLINPMGVFGAWYPIYILTQISGESKIFFQYIQELQKPITAKDVFDLDAFGFYKLAIIFSFCSFIFNRRKLDIGAFLLWLFFLLFSLSAARNLIYFAFTAYLVFVANFTSTSARNIVPLRFVERKFQYITSVVFKIMVIFWMFDFAFMMMEQGYYDFKKFERKFDFMGGVSQRAYPDKAVDFLVENKVQGNFFNDFNSGAYLVGRASPDIKVFIDGRTEVYGPEFFKLYKRVWQDGDPAQLPEFIDKYHLTGALLNSVHNPIPWKVVVYFYENKDWVPVYFDYDAVIFLKRTPENQPVIDRFAVDMANWKAPKFDLLRLGATNVTPYQPYNRAFTLDSLNLAGPALEEALEAVKIAPNYAAPYALIGKIYARKKDFQKAFENFRVSAMLDPQNDEVRYNLALVYYDLGYFPGAIKQYERMMEVHPGDPKPYFLLAKTYTKARQYAKAKEILKQALALDPKATHAVFGIGDMLYEQGAFKEALSVYQMGIPLKSDMANIYRKIGLSHQALGDYTHARENFEKAVGLDPQNEELKNLLVNLVEKENN